MTAAEARSDEFLISAAGDLFAAGFDTAQIASRFVAPEAAIAAALAVARQRRRVAIAGLICNALAHGCAR
ncbi:hypothetical protein IP86_03100 [Rhodopseudomonas sp. AAP120]|uniref:hypothetical protein n=1 Tax=Rhodopseudomonas sp. AAP120 TaxID=1523430 RepID=UPI0006B8BF60|nr:hypothetical protein [Rhodopseudomonas sp. AAP120]KPG01810.1 hypothetical protein IP86_03100 [Rhodopseudomonas sp. AAP120]